MRANKETEPVMMFQILEMLLLLPIKNAVQKTTWAALQTQVAQRVKKDALDASLSLSAPSNRSSVETTIYKVTVPPV